MVTPDLYREAAELIAPSTSDPGRSATNCAGLPEDLLLPLENELSRDSYEEESSWRHYLGMARSAAAQADALGDDLVRLGIEMDLRAEQQADALEGLCGVRLNVTRFARELPPRVTLPSGMGGTECLDGYVLVPGAPAQCVLDPIAWATTTGALADEDVNRLEQCVGSDATVPWVALGDQPVCLWQYGEDTTTLCQGADADHPCPAVARHAVAPGDCSVPDAAAQPILVTADRLLNLFSVPVGGGGVTGGPAVLPCEALARIRSGMPEGGDLEAVLGSGLLRQREFATYASGLGWVPAAGDYSRVTYGRTTLATTGSAVELAGSSLWPRGQHVGGLNVFSALCPSGMLRTDPRTNAHGMFCLSGVAGGWEDFNVRARARTNDMLARAVIAARVMAGLSLGGSVSMPYQPRVAGAFPEREDPHVSALDAVVVGGTYLEARTGNLLVDQAGDGPRAQATGLDELGASAEWIDGQVDWNHCRYDSPADTCVSQLDYVYPSSGNVRTDGIPLIVRRVGDTSVPGANAAARAFFEGPAGSLIPARFLRTYLESAARGVPSPSGHDSVLRDLTTYFHRGLTVGFDTGHGCVGGCVCEERPLACIARYEGELDVRSTFQGNVLHIGAASGGLTSTDMLNGLELTCVAARVRSDDPGFGCDAPPEIRSLHDLLNTESFLKCQADGISASAGATVIANLPADVVQAIRENGPSSLGTDSGEIAAQVRALAGGFEALSNARYEIADNLRTIAAQIRLLRSEIAQSESAHAIEDLSLQSTVWNQITSCVVAAARIPSSDTATAVGNRSGG